VRLGHEVHGRARSVRLPHELLEHGGPVAASRRRGAHQVEPPTRLLTEPRHLGLALAFEPVSLNGPVGGPAQPGDRNNQGRVGDVVRADPRQAHDESNGQQQQGIRDDEEDDAGERGRRDRCHGANDSCPRLVEPAVEQRGLGAVAQDLTGDHAQRDLDRQPTHELRDLQCLASLAAREGQRQAQDGRRHVSDARPHGQSIGRKADNLTG